MKTYIFFNPLSNNNKGFEVADKLKSVISGEEAEFIDITKIPDIDEYILTLPYEDKIIVAGGDGTLNSFINKCDYIEREIYFYTCGNGNDFARDIDSLGKLIHLNKYMKKLPTCNINGENRKFINGVGIGFDGYVCSKVNESRTDEKEGDYIKIALKGVINEYKTTNATVWVDGKKYEFEKVWLCASMKGRFYGGGFMMAPEQNRLSNANKTSLVVVHHAPVLKVLYAFLLVFKGKHTKLKKSVTILEGDNIRVELDRPSPLQIDGETYKDIISFNVTKSTVEELQEV